MADVLFVGARDNWTQWVVDRAGLIPLMSGLLSQHNNAPARIDALKDVIDARIGGTNLFSWLNMAKLIEMQVALNLTEGQLRWVIENSKTNMSHKVIDQIFPFFLLHRNEPPFLDAVSLHIDLMMISNNEYFIANQQAGFPEFGTEAWAGTINFSVEEIPKTTVAEKALAIVFPVPALAIYRNRTIARDKQHAFWGTDPNIIWLGKGDAFLHTYYQAINTQDVGAYITKLFSDAHETEHPPVLHLETEMDLFNNAIGIQLGSANSSADIHEMADIVQDNILSGACRYLDPVDHDLSPPYVSDCSTCLNGILPMTVIKRTDQ